MSWRCVGLSGLSCSRHTPRLHFRREIVNGTIVCVRWARRLRCRDQIRLSHWGMNGCLAIGLDAFDFMQEHCSGPLVA
jgi:hypothetical protein